MFLTIAQIYIACLHKNFLPQIQMQFVAFSFASYSMGRLYCKKRNEYIVGFNTFCLPTRIFCTQILLLFSNLDNNVLDFPVLEFYKLFFNMYLSIIKLTTTIPFKGGDGKILHLAGSHFGSSVHVPLLQRIGKLDASS